MPTLEALDTLKTQINELGDEPRLLAERGETLVDVAPPEAPGDPDLERMLNEGQAASGVDEMEALLGSYAEDLDDLADPDADEVGDTSGAVATADEAIDFDSLIDNLDLDEAESARADQSIADGIDDLLGDSVDEADAGLLDDAGSSDSIDAPEAFGEDDFNLDDLISDMAVLDAGDGDDADIPSGLDPMELSEDGEEPVESDDITDIDEITGLDDLTAADVVAEISEGDGFENSLTDAPVEDFSLDDLNFDDLSEADIPVDEPSDASPADDEAELAGIDASEDSLDSGDDSLPDLDDFSIEDDDELENLDFGDLENLGPADEDVPDIGDLSDIPESQEDSLDADFAGEAVDELAGLDDLSFDLDEDASVSDDLPGESGETGEPDDEIEPGEDGFSLDDLDLGVMDSDTDDAEAPDELGSLDDLDDLGDLGDLGDLDDLGDFDTSIDIPDVGAAVEELGDPDDMSDDSQEELSLDEDLNFEEELGADVLSDIRETGDDSQQFSMDDFGEQYNFKEGESGFAENLGVDLEQLEQSLDEASADEKKPFSLDDEDYRAIIHTLGTLPRNLKIALEELLADTRRPPEDLQPIINALIEGEPPKSLVARFKALTKRKIELPRSYEKRSGRVLAARRAALAYRLIKEGWPVIRTILLIIAIAWISAAALFMWAYRPLKADSLYNTGLEAVSVDDVEEAVDRFYDAWDGWPLFPSRIEDGDRISDAPIIVRGWKDKGRWLDYARALRRRKHWSTAEKFYIGYLAVKPDDKAARLEYSAFLSDILGKYEKAIVVLENAPTSARGIPDRDYMLAIGDVYLQWAEDDPTRYEDARYRYAKVLETSRNDERAILSMMRYHLRLADQDEIEALLPIFDTEIPGKTDEPFLAAKVFAGLGDYHLVRGDSFEARRFINLALAADPRAPEPSYADARFWRSQGDDEAELRALKRTLVNLDGRESLGRLDLQMRILTLGGMGRIHSHQFKALSDDPQAASEARTLATNFYNKALDLYEDARQRNQLGAAPEYGSLYLEIGDVFYEGSSSPGDLLFSMVRNRESLVPESDRYAELSQAEYHYSEAEKLFSKGSESSRLPDEALYRRAYARRELGIESSLVDFHRVVRRRSGDYEARLALATTLLETGDYEASRSQYARTLELLDNELRATGGVLDPLLRKNHEELLLRYIVAWNNLGVGRARSAARGGGEDDYAAALSAFTMASEYLDTVYGDMDDLISRGAASLRSPENESRIILESQLEGRSILKEKTTFPYRNRLRILGLESAEAGEDIYLMYPDIPSDLLGSRTP